MSSTKQTPLEIAKERYAKGEITKEQYDQIKKDLT
jgi:putative membrane protein